MKITSIFLGLAATTAAIDIRLFDQNGCNQNRWSACNNANPDFCCGLPGNVFRGVGFAAIPREWNIIGRAFDSGNCAREIGSGQSLGSTDICQSGAPFSGGRYNFVGKKRDAASTSSQECQLPNSLSFEDGTELDISTLDAEGSTTVHELFFAGATTNEVEEQIKALE